MRKSYNIYYQCLKKLSCRQQSCLTSKYDGINKNAF